MKLGYDKDHLVYVSLRTDAAKTYPVLKNELQGDTLVPGVTASFQPPMSNGMRESGATWEGKDPEARTYVFYDDVDYDYAETMGLEFAAGVGSLALALVMVGYQALRAALANPVEALKYE
jgi:hypothetical protein